MRQLDFRRIPLAFLEVLTGNSDIGLRQIPPVWETLTVLVTLSKFPFTDFVDTIDITTACKRGMDRQGISRYLKRICHIIP